ncbi:MAG: hypothetical protein A3F82_10520 [Deltaproteobacteria bacterium RIFCSPLOWO2_12_FULL_44_12]|nr:MAG: hypothetical protein A2712_07550 [Deltaproteobacteria bacterium RIFCSPHIGHO2_01_FULL_43_49]OGQ14802.1 MAG: hypothetical protein A3D22_09445 [Deltaproteobacteria bacterium RIFCSPHIGHO2_02_FULL_44_53]OGQ28188.1 MAG: hypothetical protein A3D98_08155 [Deltaproteobacteria bacterium RIFCSPHIGHO2_12_FULL_44_21]OGQ31400.1 MAG: hypothetical protein A2979_08205 [Deltaproteobacteria bacterium RIFCSPLOWO2_01_FULL_45_74]OGQ43392.1 MAG: hypothetical protein A3I70_01865 [Deltaproteobacteria bacterium 
MEARLTQLLGKPVIKVTKLYGGASYRTFYRVFSQGDETFILMAMPEGKMSVSEEITNLKEKPKELSYINVQRYLKSLGLPVPEIKLFSEEDRWIILNDLGDTKLWDTVKTAQPNDIKKWYKKALDLLVILQNKTSKDISTSAHQHISTSCIAYQRSFDATLFNWEFDHFLEYYFQLSAVSCQPSAEDKDIFIKETRKITQELCAMPQVFTHRDFQGSNLMVHNNQLTMTDFQDALLGPDVYDLVSLLRDSYFDVTDYLEELLEYYGGQQGWHIKKLRRAFDLQTVQRKLKDSGRFVFIDHVKKNPDFLKFIPTSMGYVKQALARLPEYNGLYDLIKKY